jgi:hypothetical protein
MGSPAVRVAAGFDLGASDSKMGGAPIFILECRSPLPIHEAHEGHEEKKDSFRNGVRLPNLIFVVFVPFVDHKKLILYRRSSR